MGSVGVKTSVAQRLVGQNVDALKDYFVNYKQIREDFNLDFATNSQISAIADMLRGIVKYDRGHDENRTPYTIDEIRIRRVLEPDQEEIKRNKELLGRSFEDKTISVTITTIPDTDNAYVRMVDTKDRQFLIGPKGGYFTYGKGSKHKNIKAWDAQYGMRRGL